jgi:hypothetical protein
MSQILVRYFVNSVFLDGSGIHGVQTATLNRSSDVTTIIPKGVPNSVKNFYKKPTVSVSFTKFLSPSVPSLMNGFILRDKIMLAPSGHKLEVGVVGGGGFTLTDAVLSSVVFNYPTQGFFTEELTYTGNLISEYPNYCVESFWLITLENYNGNGLVTFQYNHCDGSFGSISRSINGSYNEKITVQSKDIPVITSKTGLDNVIISIAIVEEYGTVYRRQHFTKSIPAGIPETTLLSVTTSLNINYGQIPTYGGFLSLYGKYISFPVDVSCTYEMLDVGNSISQINSNTGIISFGATGATGSVGATGPIIKNAAKDLVTDVAISISGPPTINLGSKNFLSSIDRSGGDAGQSNYSTVKYTFKNNDNSFTVS